VSSTTVYMSEQYAHKRMVINFLSILILVAVTLMAAFLIVWTIGKIQTRDARIECNEIAKNSSYVTKFTGKTCWIQINDGADGVTSEAWIPSEWMTMG